SALSREIPRGTLGTPLAQVRSPTNARGKAAPGSSPARTSSPDTSASTRASNPSAARTVTAASPAPTTWPCTAGGTS
uniref:Uncharacterized protein n=1 Tax=Malurus cyaneus samueli TaxID=2593467 RepID=A0A8C5UDE8_9PASS